MHRPHNLYEMYHVRPCKPSKSPDNANTSYPSVCAMLPRIPKHTVAIYEDTRNTLRLPRIQHYRKEQYLEVALRPDAYRRQSTLNYVSSIVVKADDEPHPHYIVHTVADDEPRPHYIVHTVHKLRTRSEYSETRRVEFDISYELANLDLPNRLLPQPMPHSRKVIGWTIPDVANEYTEHYMEYSPTLKRNLIFDYDAVLLYNWHTITSTHIRRLTQLIAKDAVAIYLRYAEKHHVIDNQEVYMPIPTIATLSNMLQSPNRRFRRQTIKTLLAMGIRWHPSYTTIVPPDSSSQSRSLPAIYPVKHRHEMYHSYIIKTGFKPIYFNPFKMIACDVILMFTICCTVSDQYYLPPELRMIILHNIDLLSILPSINSVQRYLHAMYF